MQSKLLLSSVLTALLITSIRCQQMVNFLRSASNSQSSSQPSQSQPQQQQPQLLSLEQQQQLLQQLAALTAQQQRQQQPSQPQQYAPQQGSQQFFDPNQFFGNQGGQSQPQQMFSPQQFVIQPQQQQQQPPAQSQPQPSQSPSINWGKCPQLEPSDKEKMTKAAVITRCLETTPLPGNISRETVEVHREQIAACALQSEGWFTGDGRYDFTKAENEIKNKRMNKNIEDQVVSYHKQCKQESEEKFPFSKTTVIAQIQLYQACMDYFISDVCGIEVNEPEAPQFA